MEITKLGSQPSGKGPEDWFTGAVRIDPLFQANNARRAAAAAVTNDEIDFELKEENGAQIIIFNRFTSDRLLQKIDEYNQKKSLSKQSRKLIEDEDIEEDENDSSLRGTKQSAGTFKSIEISDEGLELIELISLDCTNNEGIWQSDEEIKIDKNGFVIKNGIKTKTFWDATISANKKPLRMKVRNIAGDETVLDIINKS